MKTIKMPLALVLCIALSISFSAHVSSSSEFYYQNENITVTFDIDSVLSSDKQQLIADKIVLGNGAVDDSVSTYALCWLVGHDIVSEGVTVVEHKVSDTDPRCRRSAYAVDTCANCDYLEYTLISSVMTLCCPEE